MIRAILPVLAACWLTFSCASAQTALLEYRMNGTGPALVNSGSLTGYDLTMFDERGGSFRRSVDNHGAPGSGVSGSSGDRAFDNSIAGTGGHAGEVPADRDQRGAQTSSYVAEFNDIEAFTVQGWFKVRQPLSKGARLFSHQDDVPQASQRRGFNLQANTSSVLRLEVGNTTQNATSTNTNNSLRYADTDTWVFFAVSYDGTKSTDNVRFYKATLAESLSPPSVASLDRGRVAPQTNFPLTIGNRTVSNDGPLNGLIDNMRFFDRIVTADELANIYGKDKVDIPEPAATALLGVALSCGIILFRRR